jgi:hypothetical protein
LIENGLFLFNANGTAIPIMKTKDGKTKSAGLNPYQEGCLSHQGASFPLQSTMIIPTIVMPRKMSKEFSLCFMGFLGGYYKTAVLSTGCTSDSSKF